MYVTDHRALRGEKVEVTDCQWLLVGEMQAGILRAILGTFESFISPGI